MRIPSHIIALCCAAALHFTACDKKEAAPAEPEASSTPATADPKSDTAAQPAPAVAGSGDGQDAGLSAEGAAALDAITAEHAKVGTTPEGALALWIREAALYHKQPEAGKATLGYLTIDFKGSPNWTALNSTRTFVERLEERPWIFRSYAKGSAPDNNYAMDPAAFELNVEKSHPDQHGDRGHAVFVRSSGADSARPIYLKKSSKTGLYFVAAYANAYVDIRKPVDPEAETFE